MHLGEESLSTKPNAKVEHMENRREVKIYKRGTGTTKFGTTQRTRRKNEFGKHDTKVRQIEIHIVNADG